MIAIATQKIQQISTPIPSIASPVARETRFTIGVQITRAEIERNEWLDK
jgi:hypothetical protein